MNIIQEQSFLKLLVFSLFLISVSWLPQNAHAECQNGELAKAYDFTVCKEDIRFTETDERNLTALAQRSGENPEDTIRNYKHSNLFSQIWEKSVRHKFGDTLSDPSEKQIQTFIDYFNQGIEKNIESAQKTLEYAESNLNNESLPQDVKQKLQSLKSESQRFIALSEAQEQAPEALKPQIEKGREIIAQNAIENWAIKKVLYNHYGGKVIESQGGLEPVGAYKDFFEEIKNEGGLKILDSEYDGAFGTLEKFLNLDHENEVIASDSTIEDYFKDPFWIYTSDFQEKQLQKAAEELEKLTGTPLNISE